MKINKTLGYTVFFLSIIGALFFTSILIEKGLRYKTLEDILIISMATTFSFTIYYSYFTTISPKKTPLEELDSEIYIIKKKIQNKKLLKNLEELESKNENNEDLKS